MIKQHLSSIAHTLAPICWPTQHKAPPGWLTVCTPAAAAATATAAAAAAAALITEDFGLLQLYAESFQTGGALATYLKSYRAANKKKKGDAGNSTADPPMSPAKASTVVMVAASALAAQVYPDSRFGSLHAKQLTGGWVRACGTPLAELQSQEGTHGSCKHHNALSCCRAAELPWVIRRRCGQQPVHCAEPRDCTKGVTTALC